MAGLSDGRSAARQREEEMAAAILRYLAEHSHASDTLEGIAGWWLLRQEVRADVETVARVLRRLTDAGHLERIGQGESSRYRLRPVGPEHALPKA
jgi:Fe2+ or Zn2+ uptake regulation protein